MIDVMENIKKLSAALDAETASLHPSGKLLLLGSQDSVFLKAIKRKADQLGINCDHTSNSLPPYRGIVVDSETVSFNSILDPDVDIDHSYSPGMSAVSQAVMDLLIESGLVWEKDITIVAEADKDGRLVALPSDKALTNADRMRAATNQQLAKLLYDNQKEFCRLMYKNLGFEDELTFSEDYSDILAWLNAPAEMGVVQDKDE